MSNFRLSTTILLTLLLPISLYASGLDQCLSIIKHQQDRIEKEDTIRFCFDKYKKNITRKSCYSGLVRVASKVNSTRLSEDIKSICFYETGSFKDLKDCLKETENFKNSTNHDEAVFSCFQDFQDVMTKKDCLTTANRLIYPQKKEHLNRYCNSNVF